MDNSAEDKDKNWKTRHDWSEYMSAKRDKLFKQLNEELNEKNGLNQLFSGICVHINGVTDPSELDLKRMVVAFGGMYLNHFDAKRTTHTIASNLSFAKTKNWKTNKIVVKPDWLTDSIAAQRLLPVQDYLLIRTDPNLRPFLISDESNDQNIDLIGQFVSDIHELIDSNDSNGDHIQTNSSNERSDPTIGTVKTTICERVVCEDLPLSANPIEFSRCHYIPNSLSQIDPQFLESLPMSLRHDIMSDIESNNKTFIKTELNLNKKKRKYKTKNNKSSPKKSANNDSNHRMDAKTVPNSDDNPNEANGDLSRGPLDLMFKDMKNQRSGGLLTSAMSANICGKTDIKDVMDLIEEWVTTEEDLIDEDIAYVTKYFCDLVDERKYNRLKQICNQLYNCVEKRWESVWKQCFNDIRNTVITEMNANKSNHKTINPIIPDLPYFQFT